MHRMIEILAPVPSTDEQSDEHSRSSFYIAQQLFTHAHACENK